MTVNSINRQLEVHRDNKKVSSRRKFNTGSLVHVHYHMKTEFLLPLASVNVAQKIRDFQCRTSHGFHSSSIVADQRHGGDDSDAQ